ncbi:hypothetical protein MICA_1871 [Micavibrio aeruginosavorus ARL-13]|uniref:Uncharacterized protein n=1 Tax=Micavibrio aeruginosavorus (strain ARL-13) TaxID=856793 RepID=G2KM88_MICAA|nr:hypothetical protein MICA_1871 [Micavibrio aeruginosavorus ARL-13]
MIFPKFTREIPIVIRDAHDADRCIHLCRILSLSRTLFNFV